MGGARLADQGLTIRRGLTAVGGTARPDHVGVSGALHQVVVYLADLLTAGTVAGLHVSYRPPLCRSAQRGATPTASSDHERPLAHPRSGDSLNDDLRHQPPSHQIRRNGHKLRALRMDETFGSTRFRDQYHRYSSESARTPDPHPTYKGRWQRTAESLSRSLTDHAGIAKGNLNRCEIGTLGSSVYRR